MVSIFYGIEDRQFDVTEICLTKMRTNNIINIPCGDNNRANYFSDVLPNIHKKIFILINDNVNVNEYDENYTIKINLDNSTIHAINDGKINTRIKMIHSRLKIKHGSFNEELPEQKMAVRYLTGNETVLEIGGNIGRNTLVIAFILGNKNKFVTLECDLNIAKQLNENRILNRFNFHIENSALSKRKLIQRGWDTIPSDTIKDGYKLVNTITFDQLKTKYNMVFDTLVLDCEGAFYYILMDMPEILNNIKLIIMENDYCDISKKQYIDEILIKNNFYIDYQEAGGWGPCFKNFFEVWKKTAF
jgi:FkbM family methyltransferase